MSTYKTPGVYVKEIPSFPPSVAGVATAIPAFIGYTEKADKDKKDDLLLKPTRIDNLLDYGELFGGPEPTLFEVTVEGGAGADVYAITDVISSDPNFLMYHNLDMYFKNGGGPCYIVSVGGYMDDKGEPAAPARKEIEAGLEVLKKEDEPTLILLVDAIKLDAVDYNALCQAALKQCGELQDRFCIFDVVQNSVDIRDMRKDVQDFRNGIGVNNLKYGAAYYPWLRTTLNHPYTDDTVLVSGIDLSKDITAEHETDKNGIRIFYTKAKVTGIKVEIKEDDKVGKIDFSVTTTTNKLTIKLPKSADPDEPTSAYPVNVVAAWNSWKETNDQRDFDIQQAGNGSATVYVTKEAVALAYAQKETQGYKLREFKYDKTALYNQIKTRVEKERVILPPSAIMAGIYAFMDRSMGVWSAPANVGLASVIEPMVKLNSRDQEDLNVDSSAGKSINVIRFFTGKGVIVWGARTLMGNDNEWRYINVRRLFNMVEESVQKATVFAVFQPNTAMTWLKVRAMIESFLEDLWRAGGLAGETMDQAYFVNVGLGITMTAQDILEGRMNVEIGLAAVRPAEFIILKFSHKMQEG